jgi:hypothetical protein
VALAAEVQPSHRLLSGNLYARSEDLMVLLLGIQVFWGLRLCHRVSGSQCFVGMQYIFTAEELLTFEVESISSERWEKFIQQQIVIIEDLNPEIVCV